MRRCLTLSLFSLLVLAPSALAAAGRGSSGFGGGGGSRSGGGAGGPGFYPTGGGGGGGSFLGVVVIVGIIVAFLVAGALLGAVQERGRRRRRSARAKRVHTAAAEAAEDDEAFAVDRVEADAKALFLAIQHAWTRRDLDALAGLCGRDLLVEWRRRLADFERKGWHNQVKVLAGPQLFYVGMTNRAADEEDRVVVLVEATMRDVAVTRGGAIVNRQGSSSETVALREYWTLHKHDGAWRLESIEQLGEGDHHLSADLVASPWSDGRMRDEALVEVAVADAAAAGTDFGGLVDLDYAGDARAAALDLSLVDARFSPAVLEAGAHRALAAWARAVDGPDDALLAVASEAAVADMLYPRGAGRARVVVRGPGLQRMTLRSLDADAQPPEMVVELELSGRRYVEDRDTQEVLEGSRERETRWTERWTFALAGSDAAPWRVVAGGLDRAA